MKTILFFTCAVILPTSAGCIVAEGGSHQHARYEGPPQVIAGPPVIELRPPEIIVR